MKFLILTRHDGIPIRLAVSSVIGYLPLIEEDKIVGTQIQLPDQAHITVAEQPVEVDAMLAEAAGSTSDKFFIRGRDPEPKAQG